MSQSIIGVYAIHNTITDWRYIGSSLDVERRWQEHRVLLRQGRHHNHALQAAWRRHGEDSFVFVLIEEAAPKAERRSGPLSKEMPEVIAIEQAWADHFAPRVYNRHRHSWVVGRAGSQIRPAGA